MAFMSQERKAVIAEELKKVIPKEWKWSLSVHNHSEITLTIKSAPIDLLAARIDDVVARNHVRLNEFYLEREFKDDLLETFQAIRVAINIQNHNNSDTQTDYFDVGYYVNIQIGRWDRPFIVK